MGRKKALEKRMKRLRAKRDALKARGLASQDASEVRSINEQIEDINSEIEETQEEIDAIDAIDADDQRSAAPTSTVVPDNAQHVNATAVRGAFGQQTDVTQARDNSDPYGTMEYREAFKAYVQRGVPIPAELTQRAGGDPGVTVAGEIGMIVPTTIMNEFIKEVSKVYGQIYAKVRKLNVQGGVKFPISNLSANFSWITETTVSEKQKAGDIKEYIEFSYNIGEIRVAQSLLSQVVALSMFENEITRIMVEAYVKTMDEVIISGTGVGQPLGVINDTRITEKSGHIVTFTTDEMAKWESWRKKLFAKIPLSKRGQGEFIFTSATVESNLLTMKDTNERPIFKEATEMTIGESATAGSFYGRTVTLVEPGIVEDFDTAAAGDVIGLYWVPTDYALNTNMTFGMKRYFDEETNQWVNKGLTIVDGKILDPSGCYIIKKA